MKIQVTVDDHQQLYGRKKQNNKQNSMSVNAEEKCFFESRILYLAKLSVREGDIFKHVRAQTIYHPQTSSEKKILQNQNKRIRESHRFQGAVDLTQDCSEKQCQNEKFEADLESLQFKLEQKSGSEKNLKMSIGFTNKYSD